MSVPRTKAVMPIGRKIERIREIRGIKQETLAAGLGITQQAVSKMEQSDEVDDERLAKVAELLGVTADAIKNFSEEAMINNIQNTFHDHSIQNQFNPVEKIVELYERLLESEREKVTLLQDALKSKK